MNEQRTHFMLIKHSGFSADLHRLTAYESALMLLCSALWPLWTGTRCKHMVKAGHDVLIYIAGSEEKSKCVIASARVKNTELWSNTKHKNNYPLLIDGIPEKVLLLENINLFNEPVDVKKKLDTLTFMPVNKKKWGVAMMGGMRSLLTIDYNELVGH